MTCHFPGLIYAVWGRDEERGCSSLEIASGGDYREIIWKHFSFQLH